MRHPRGIPCLTPEQDLEIQRLRQEDPRKWTLARLAEKFNCSQGTAARCAAGKYSFGRVHQFTISDEDLRIEHARYMDGVSCIEIGKRYHVQDGAVRAGFKRLGLPLHNLNQFTDDQLRAAYADYLKSGGQTAEVASSYGVKRGRLHHGWKRLGLPVIPGRQPCCKRGTAPIASVDISDRPVPAWKVADQKRQQARMY